MYWPLEGSVTTVDSAAISSGNDIGSSCFVTIKKEKFEGRIAAKGNKNMCNYLCNIRRGSKLEMEQCEDDLLLRNGSHLFSIRNLKKEKIENIITRTTHKKPTKIRKINHKRKKQKNPKVRIYLQHHRE